MKSSGAHHNYYGGIEIERSRIHNNLVCDVIVVLPCKNQEKPVALLIQCKELVVYSDATSLPTIIQQWRNQRDREMQRMFRTTGSPALQFYRKHHVVHVFCTVNKGTLEPIANNDCSGRSNPNQPNEALAYSEAFMSLEGITQWCPMVGYSGVAATTRFTVQMAPAINTDT